MSGCYMDGVFCNCEDCPYENCVIRFSEFTENERDEKDETCM